MNIAFGEIFKNIRGILENRLLYESGKSGSLGGNGPPRAEAVRGSQVKSAWSPPAYGNEGETVASDLISQLGGDMAGTEPAMGLPQREAAGSKRRILPQAPSRQKWHNLAVVKRISPRTGTERNHAYITPAWRVHDSWSRPILLLPLPCELSRAALKFAAPTQAAALWLTARTAQGDSNDTDHRLNYFFVTYPVFQCLSRTREVSRALRFVCVDLWSHARGALVLIYKFEPSTEINPPHKALKPPSNLIVYRLGVSWLRPQNPWNSKYRGFSRSWQANSDCEVIQIFEAGSSRSSSN